MDVHKVSLAEVAFHFGLQADFPIGSKRDSSISHDHQVKNTHSKTIPRNNTITLLRTRNSAAARCATP